MIGGPLLLYESVADSISDCGLLSEMGKKQALKILNLVKGKSYFAGDARVWAAVIVCLLYTSPSPRDLSTSRMPSSA